MQTRNYWLDLFSGTTWQEFIKAGGNISGFRESRWSTVQKIKPGDYLICYLTGVSRFIGILEVTSEPYKDSSPIWNDNVFLCRLQVKPVIELTPDIALPVFELRDDLSFFQNLKSPSAWTGHFRASPALWKEADGEIVFKALRNAKVKPVSRPVDPKKLAKKPQGLWTKTGPVTVPEPEKTEPIIDRNVEQIEVRKHVEVQFQLLKLGHDMGFNVWVARNDRSREINGKKFSEMFKLKDNLPLQFDEPTTKTIELIDVLWLKGNAIVSAFEVESTTSIYSGLLRMSDLLAMQPNLNIPLFLVASDERREKVFFEVNRPTFSRLSPPLSQVCRFISFTTLQEYLSRVGSFVRYLKPEFLDELSEVCELDEY
jgi:predicted RNA-binding protein